MREYIIAFYEAFVDSARETTHTIRHIIKFRHRPHDRTLYSWNGDQFVGNWGCARCHGRNRLYVR